MVVECRIVPGEDEYELMTDVMMHSMKAVRIQRISMLVVMLLGIAGAGYCLFYLLKYSGKNEFFTTMTVVFLSLILFCAYWLKSGLRKKMISALRRANLSMDNRERRYIFDQDIHVHTEKKDSILKWKDVCGWGERGNLIYLRFPGQFVIVDKNQIIRGSGDELKKMFSENGLGEKQERNKKRR